MSWDVSIFAAKNPPPPVEEMPDDWRGSSLGTCDQVRKRVSDCLPATDWNDPTWGIFDGDGFSYEFNIGQDDPCDGFMVHIRGAGNAIPPLLELIGRWNWYALDTSQGEWWHHCSNVEAGWKSFQEYRDRMLRSKGDFRTEDA